MTYRDRDRGDFEPPLPKPYEFVPLPARAAQRPPAGHQRYQHLNGVLHGVLIARSPVHVASGLLETTRNRDYPMVKAHFRSNKQLTIPGTSLKGCIRSILEAISPSGVTITRARPLNRELEPSRSPDHLDVAQRIFGTMGYQGQVRFSDAVLEAGEPIIVPTPQLFRPRSESVNTYFEGRQLKGRKFYMHGALAKGDLPLEACPIGSRFSFRMDFENLTSGELGLVLFALGLGEPRLWPKLGGGKPACLGTVEVERESVRLEQMDAQALYADFETAAMTLEMSPLLEAAKREKLVLEQQLKVLAGVLRWPREDRGCPDRSY